ncbi:kinase-like domain-containing protein [Lactifluus subvellereus]|nr:kinase-like domain-containing protein [Lactifluus subvellereus]
MAPTDAPDTASSEGDGQDSSEPPNGDRKQPVATPRSLKTAHHNDLITPTTTDTSHQKDSEQRPFANGNANHTQQGPSTSISPASPDHSTHFRESGNVASHRGLEPLVLPQPSIQVQASCSTATSTSSSPTSSPTPSESNPWSPPPSQPPSQAPSRAASMSGTKPDLSSLLASPVLGLTKVSKKERPAPVTPVEQSPALRSKGPPSVHSTDGGTKFNLKDLLGSAPKLTRKSSARSSASSRKSDSEGGPKSTGGESTGSFLQKYGTCERVAIGRGATSVVRLAHKWDRSEEKLYAVKEFRKRRKNESEKEYVKKLTAEFCISSTLHHINIVETVDLVQDENQHWCEVMEFCPGGDLYAAIKKGHMSPSEIECCFRQILQGVSYLHSQGVAHRDIKPENVFFSGKGHLKIGDYGASTVYRLPWESTVHMSSGLCGSEPYIAPEQFLGKPYDARLVDVWAVAIVYYCLHFQELPWRAAQASDGLYAAYASACANPQQSATPPTINNLNPRACRSLIRRMLEPDPKQRALIDECVSHPWVQTIEVCHMVPNPSHIHVYAQSLARTVMRG